MYLAISTEEQKLILDMTNGLPPEFVLENLTPDQKNHWCDIKYLFKILHNALSDFFSGSPSSLVDLPEKEKEIASHMVDYYISLYSLIQWGWKDILRAFSEWRTEHYGEQFPLVSPGEALAAILERHAAAMFWQCKGRHDFKPRKLYQLRLQEKKIAKGSLSSKQVSQYEKDITSLAKPFESFMELEFFCVDACQLAAKTQKDKILRAKIQDYETKRRKLDDLIHTYFRDMKGYAFENGRKLETAKDGGTYRSSS